MTSIFISYSRKDIEFANRIAAELRARGAEVFLDHQKLRAGNFMSQLGREIEKCDAFLVVVSPNSINSHWVEHELTWAITKRKKIVPITLEEPDSYANLFVVTSMETVDAKRWNTDGQLTSALKKLSRLLEITETLVHAVQPLEKVSYPEPDTEEVAQIEFDKSDVEEMFLTAVEIAEDDPDRAIYLYEQILEVNPNHNSGHTKQWLEREKQELEPFRIQLAERYMSEGEWAKALAQLDAVIPDEPPRLSPYSRERKYLRQRFLRQNAKQNLKCLPTYEQAIIAAEKGRWKAVDRLLQAVNEECPEYGDPADLLSQIPDEE